MATTRSVVLTSLLAVCIIVATGAFGVWLHFARGNLQKDSTYPRVGLTSVCDAFKVKHLRYPDNLNELLVRDQFNIVWVDDSSRLLDPFGKPYQYDKNGPRNKGLHPDIWHVAPDGTMIGNWPNGR